ncbi:MAG: hypothetical protein ACMZ66_01595 [Thalassospira sp.]|uniref:hypothetical protein n=1 Tax=Thalassospira sp. TaxID=1912094 RepID=UPI003A89AFFC
MKSQSLNRTLALVGLGMGTGLLSLPDAQASDAIDFPFDPVIGETRTYQVEKTRETHRNGTITKNTLTMSVPITVRATDQDGLEMEVTYNDIDVVGAEAGDKNTALAAGLAKLTEGFVFHYRASPTGVPITLSNMDAVQADLLPAVFERLDDIIAQYSSDPQIAASLAPIRQAFANMTPQAGAQMTLRDIQPIFALTGLEMPETGVIEINNDVPWELTGSNLKAVGEIKLIDSTDEQATIELHQNYTRESVRNGIAFLMAQTAGMDKASMERATKQIRAWEDYDIQTDITATLPRTGSWPQRVDHTQTFIAAGQKQITQMTFILQD